MGLDVETSSGDVAGNATGHSVRRGDVDSENFVETKTAAAIIHGGANRSW
jgi:hypothetical protein